MSIQNSNLLMALVCLLLASCCAGFGETSTRGPDKPDGQD